MIDFTKEEYKIPDGWFSQYDMALMYPALKDSTEADNYLEIGVNRGRSLAFARRHFNGRVHGIDMVSLEDSGGAPVEGTHFILGDSTKVKWDKPIKVLFIDGEHRYETVKTEWEKYTPFVVDGGWVFFHDSDDTSPEVREFTEEIGAVQSDNPRCSMAYIRIDK